jgi:signal transduction histidine kinase/CheY-like chemotaxis protein
MRQTTRRTGVGETSADPDLEALETSSVVATLSVSMDGRIVGANSRMRELLGIATAQSPQARLPDFLANPSVWAEWRDAGVATRPVEVFLRGSGGAEQVLRGDICSRGEGSARRIVAILVDGADGRALRAAAQHSARMEALGSLTAGIAHDFNNLLTVLVGNLYLIGEELRERPRAFEKLKAARDAGKRGADLIKQLLTFARREALEVDVVDPAKVIEGVAPLLRRALGARITLETSLHAASGAVRANAAQLESAIVNLAMNARDAIEGRGRITIDVRPLASNSSEAALRGLCGADRYVSVSVRDTGSGIPPEALGRVFEPFFSTKGERGGTGLGLSMVRWLAEQAGGAATIESVVGRGTTVTLVLPRETEQPQDVDERTMPLSTLPAGTERVVVLAIDDALRATIHQTLEVLGYRVRVAVGAQDLLAAVAAESTQLVVVDGLGSGDADLLIRARAVAPGLKIIMTSDAARSANPGWIAGVATLIKPFSLAELAGTVRRSLDAVD